MCKTACAVAFETRQFVLSLETYSDFDFHTAFLRSTDFYKKAEGEEKERINVCDAIPVLWI